MGKQLPRPVGKKRGARSLERRVGKLLSGVALIRVPGLAEREWRVTSRESRVSGKHPAGLELAPVQRNL